MKYRSFFQFTQLLFGVSVFSSIALASRAGDALSAEIKELAEASVVEAKKCDHVVEEVKALNGGLLPDGDFPKAAFKTKGVALHALDKLRNYPGIPQTNIQAMRKITSGGVDEGELDLVNMLQMKTCSASSYFNLVKGLISSTIHFGFNPAEKAKVKAGVFAYLKVDAAAPMYMSPLIARLNTVQLLVNAKLLSLDRDQQRSLSLLLKDATQFLDERKKGGSKWQEGLTPSDYSKLPLEQRTVVTREWTEEVHQARYFNSQLTALILSPPTRDTTSKIQKGKQRNFDM